MAKFKIGKQEIFFRDLGEGEPVVLIHGWPLSSAMWEYQELALVEAGFRVITYDRRGFGRSSWPTEAISYDRLADDLHALLDHLGLARVALAGFSMGGGEVARYLSRHGAERITGAMLISSVIPYLLRASDNPHGVAEDVLHQMKVGIREDRHQFMAGFAHDFYGMGLLTATVSPAVLDWTKSLTNQASLKATIESVDAFGRTDFRRDLAAFTVPTLVIHGDADKTVPYLATGEAAAKAIPGAEWKLISGAPHGLFLTHKEQLNRLMVGFLQERKAKATSAA